MSDSYILHDVMRKVKAEGLFDSIRRDLLSDIEQKVRTVSVHSDDLNLCSTRLAIVSEFEIEH